jgi:hypothetical protein
MRQARAEEIARTLGERHVVVYRSQKCLVVNVTRALSKGVPVRHLLLSTDLHGPVLGDGGIYAPVRQVWEPPA